MSGFCSSNRSMTSWFIWWRESEPHHENRMVASPPVSPSAASVSASPPAASSVESSRLSACPHADNASTPVVNSAAHLTDERNLRWGRILLLLDRKSTRLNSRHVAISYAVFCL